MNELVLRPNPETVHILVVDDDLGDAKAIRRSLAKARIANPMVHLSDGVEALDFLRGPDAPARFIMLVDLNMPRMSGIELVRELRAQPLLRRAIVFILTTSHDKRDLDAAHDLNVTGYVLKSRIGEDFMKLIDAIDGYWKVVEIPVIEGTEL